MKSFRIFAFLLLFLSQFSFASPIPKGCPSIASLQPVAIDEFKEMEAGAWFGIVRSNDYQTDNKWTFIVIVPGANENEAKQNTSIILSRLNLIEGPEAYEEHWRCRYYDDGGYMPMAVAITPVMPFLDLGIIRN